MTMAYDRLWELTHRKPFVPFRVEMNDGLRLDVIRPNQVAVLPRQFVAEWNGQLKFFGLSDVARVEELQVA